MLFHLVLGLGLAAAGLCVLVFRKAIARAVHPIGRRSGVLANPLYYLAVGYAVVAVGLIFTISALVGFYR